ERHDEVKAPLVLPAVEDLDDVGMAERGGEPRLAKEPLARRRPGIGVSQRLERDDAVELAISRPVDDAVGSPRQLADHFVPAKILSHDPPGLATEDTEDTKGDLENESLDPLTKKASIEIDEEPNLLGGSSEV